MHCRDLNPYVESALADWRKSHAKQGQLPRAAAGMACGGKPRAAGMHQCSPHALLAPACDVHPQLRLGVMYKRSTRPQMQHKKSRPLVQCAMYNGDRHLLLRHERRQRPCHPRAIGHHLSGRRARVCRALCAAPALACRHGATPAGACPGLRPRSASLRMHPPAPGAVVPVGPQGADVSFSPHQDRTGCTQGDEPCGVDQQDFVCCDWTVAVTRAAVATAAKTGHGAHVCVMLPRLA